MATGHQPGCHRLGFLAAAVALGVANFVAAFVRPQASPIIAVGEAFIDRTPPALKNFAVQKFSLGAISISGHDLRAGAAEN